MKHRFYAACLASYTNGVLHGAWIDLDSDADVLREAVQAMLAASKQPGAEEWAVHDTEGWLLKGVGEYPGLDTLAEIADAIEHCEADSVDVGLFAAWRDVGDDINAAAVERFRDCYAGSGSDEAAWCAQWMEDTGEHEGAPKLHVQYFDYEAYARDLMLDGVVQFVHHDNETHAFWNR
jgi:antirestriction protein